MILFFGGFIYSKTFSTLDQRLNHLHTKTQKSHMRIYLMDERKKKKI